MTALITDSPQLTRTARTFHVVAVAEALSWAILLVAMFFKWIVQEDPHSGIQGGVPIAGAVHGVIFIAYVVTSLVAWRRFRWSLATLAAALGCGVPPFFTLLFDRAARRRALLEVR